MNLQVEEGGGIWYLRVALEKVLVATDRGRDDQVSLDF